MCRRVSGARMGTAARAAAVVREARVSQVGRGVAVGESGGVARGGWNQTSCEYMRATSDADERSSVRTMRMRMRAAPVWLRRRSVRAVVARAAAAAEVGEEEGVKQEVVEEEAPPTNIVTLARRLWPFLRQDALVRTEPTRARGAVREERRESVPPVDACVVDFTDARLGHSEANQRGPSVRATCDATRRGLGDANPRPGSMACEL